MPGIFAVYSELPESYCEVLEEIDGNMGDDDEVAAEDMHDLRKTSRGRAHHGR